MTSPADKTGFVFDSELSCDQLNATHTQTICPSPASASKESRKSEAQINCGDRQTETDSQNSSGADDEMERYFKLGEILAKTENLASKLPPPELSMREVEVESDVPHISECGQEELDPLATYYYLGNVYAAIPNKFPFAKRGNHR
jgi:hypothetical protein